MQLGPDSNPPDAVHACQPSIQGPDLDNPDPELAFFLV